MKRPIPKHRPERKVLSVKFNARRDPDNRPPDEHGEPVQFIPRDECAFMVYREGGDMPKRLYAPEEIEIAVYHARGIAQETGARVHVLRTWRAYDAVEAGE